MPPIFEAEGFVHTEELNSFATTAFCLRANEIKLPGEKVKGRVSGLVQMVCCFPTRDCGTVKLQYGSRLPHSTMFLGGFEGCLQLTGVLGFRQCFQQAGQSRDGDVPIQIWNQVSGMPDAVALVFPAIIKIASQFYCRSMMPRIECL